MSDSWGHALERLGPERLAELDTCTLGRVTHDAPATYYASYKYVTGRAGRVSWASKLVCDEHAAKFAAKHGIDLATVPVQAGRPKHASEQMVEQFFGGGSA